MVSLWKEGASFFSLCHLVVFVVLKEFAMRLFGFLHAWKVTLSCSNATSQSQAHWHMFCFFSKRSIDVCVHKSNQTLKTAISQYHNTQQHTTTCEGVGGVQGALTLFCGGVTQAFHDDRVVELKEQLVVEEVDGEEQEGKVKEEGRGRVKENAPWMTWR